MAKASRLAGLPEGEPAGLPHEFHPCYRGIDADDLRDWTGDSTLIEAYPEYDRAITSVGTKAISLTPAGTGATGAA